MLRSLSTIVVTALAVGLLVTGCESTRAARNSAAPVITAPPDDAPAPLRIGTYDSRAIAIAWARSGHNPVGTMRRERDAARAAGDEARVRELEAAGPDLQRKLHFQGFGRVPVDDLLAPVAGGVAGLLGAHDLAAITMRCDAIRTDVTIVDVTEDLVRLYAPSDDTLASVRAIRAVDPLPLTVLADMPAEH